MPKRSSSEAVAVEDQGLAVQYVPLSDINYWTNNPKKHDMGALIQSIRRYGFRDAPIYDRTLNSIIAGNGRVEALAMMKEDGEEPPRGIVVQGDEWLVPVQHGVDASDEREAEAFGLDHNNLTILGGDAGIEALLGMYREDLLVEKLEALGAAHLPVSIDGDDLDALLNPPPINPADAQRFAETEELDEIFGAIQLDLVLTHEAKPYQVWSVGPHILYVVDVTTEHGLWRERLDQVEFFVPYPEPLTVFQKDRPAMLLVTPDAFAASHLLTRAAEFGMEPTLIMNDVRGGA